MMKGGKGKQLPGVSALTIENGVRREKKMDRERMRERRLFPSKKYASCLV
jgi:hypothetical protein